MAEKFYCRNCEGERNHKLLHERKFTGGNDENYPFSFIDRYQLVECCGCETVSFVNIYGDETMYTYNNYSDEPEYYYNKIIYPKYLIGCKSIPNDSYLPEIILSIYKETLEAIKSNCFLLAGGGFRAVIEAICKDLKITKPTLEQKIDELHKLGHLTQNESNRLHAVRFLGNDSLHEIQKPNLKQLKAILEIINHLLNNLYIQDKIIEDSLDVVIRDYQKFIYLLNKILSKETINTQKTLLEILGKSKRVLKPDEINIFESQLEQQIVNGEYLYLKKTSTIKNEKVVYEVVSKPEIPTFF